MKNYCVFAAMFFSLNLGAQSIENVAAFYSEGKVTITYELKGGKENQEYELKVFSSHNNFEAPLKLVLGDIGTKIKKGSTKRIEWDAINEIGPFQGEITFRIVGNPIISFAFKNPADGSSIRRGKPSVIEWEGGSKEQGIKLELYHGSERVSTLVESKNSGQFAWIVPKDFDKGEGYSVKLNSGKDSATSGLFSIKPKYPLWLKLSPVLLVGGVICLTGGCDGSIPPSSKLPDAPKPN